MSDPAITGAIIGAVLTAVLTPLIPLIINSIPPLRCWFLAKDHPLRLVAGISVLCAVSSALMITLILTSFYYRPSHIQFVADQKAKEAAPLPFPGKTTYIGALSDNRICMFTKIFKNRGPEAGATQLLAASDHWDATSTDVLGSEVTCYKILLVK